MQHIGRKEDINPVPLFVGADEPLVAENILIIIHIFSTAGLPSPAPVIGIFRAVIGVHPALRAQNKDDKSREDRERNFEAGGRNEPDDKDGYLDYRKNFKLATSDNASLEDYIVYMMKYEYFSDLVQKTLVKK